MGQAPVPNRQHRAVCLTLLTLRCQIKKLNVMNEKEVNELIYAATQSKGVTLNERELIKFRELCLRVIERNPSFETQELIGAAGVYLEWVHSDYFYAQ